VRGDFIEHLLGVFELELVCFSHFQVDQDHFMHVSDTVADSNGMASHFFYSFQDGHHFGLNFVIEFSDRL
jgi:hypothetical protein